MAYTAARLLQASGPGERRTHDRAYERADLSSLFISDSRSANGMALSRERESHFNKPEPSAPLVGLQRLVMPSR